MTFAKSAVPSREDDLGLLRALVAHGNEVGVDGDSAISDTELSAFEDMQARLLGGQRTLTDAQRSWAEQAAQRCGVSFARDNSKVPVGGPVEMPDVLKRLPKKPPRGRWA